MERQLFLFFLEFSNQAVPNSHNPMMFFNLILKAILLISQIYMAFPFVSAFKDSFSLSRSSSSLFANFGMQNEAFGEKMQKKPSRFDTFKIVFSGCVGVEPKDLFLKNGHHVKSFPVTHEYFNIIIRTFIN